MISRTNVPLASHDFPRLSRYGWTLLCSRNNVPLADLRSSTPRRTRLGLTAYAILRRRSPSPANPTPRSTHVSGSGTAAKEEALPANWTRNAVGLGLFSLVTVNANVFNPATAIEPAFIL